MHVILGYRWLFRENDNDFGRGIDLISTIGIHFILGYLRFVLMSSLSALKKQSDKGGISVWLSLNHSGCLSLSCLSSFVLKPVEYELSCISAIIAVACNVLFSCLEKQS